MLNSIIAGAFNDGRFFKIYGPNGAEVAAWASPLAQQHKELVVSNQNLAQENFRHALDRLMGEFSENAALYHHGRVGTGIAAK
jgi:hypothetical protein